MSAKSFWNKAKANYWAGREQDVYNIYDNATNMGNARSSYNRAATVAGAGRKELDKQWAADYKTYDRLKAAEAERARLKKILANKPAPEVYNPSVIMKGVSDPYAYGHWEEMHKDYNKQVERAKEYINAYKKYYGVNYAPPGYEMYDQ